MSDRWHPDESQLLAYADRERTSEMVGEHVASCSDCSARVAEILAALAQVGPVLKVGLPAPPKPWADLRPRLHELDAGRVQSPRPLFSRVNYKWVAAAAAVFLGAVIFRLTTGTTVSAAELLHKASVQEQRVTPPKRIRVRTKRAEWVRPAAAISGDDAVVASMFQKAGYNWTEPLSARSFAHWRSSLADKDDRVRILQQNAARVYEITTRTSQGDLASASITIRAEDLRPLRERFEFRNEEFVEVTEEFESTRPLPREQLAQSPAAAPSAITPGQELQVLSALHAIGADAGEPIEIERQQTRIVVQALVTDPDRRQQIRTALASLPYVDLRFDQPDAVSLSAPGERATADEGNANPVQELLTTKLGGRTPLENFTNHVLDLSEAALVRAHALRSLAQRFPPDVEAQLTPGERETLWSIQNDHTVRLASSVRTLNEALRPVIATGTITTADASWPAIATSVVEAAQRFDRVATETLAGKGGPGTSPDDALRALGQAASDLQARSEALQRTVARAGGR